MTYYFSLTLNTSVPVTVSLPTSPVSLSTLSSMVTTPTSPLLPQRPATPDLGIPMEMTPGQIMEAEISAGLMLDQAESPVFAPESLMSDDLDLDTDADTAHTEFDTVLQTPTQSR